MSRGVDIDACRDCRRAPASQQRSNVGGAQAKLGIARPMDPIPADFYLMARTPLPEVTELAPGEGWRQWNLAVALLDGGPNSERSHLCRFDAARSVRYRTLEPGA